MAEQGLLQPSYLYYLAVYGVSEMVPSHGSSSGGTRLHIYGSLFEIGQQFQCAFQEVGFELVTTLATVLNSSCIACTTPRQPSFNVLGHETSRWGSVSVGVLRLGDGETIYGPTFYYRPEIVLTEVRPNVVPEGGGQVTITGRNFPLQHEPEIVCSFGGNSTLVLGAF